MNEWVAEGRKRVSPRVVLTLYRFERKRESGWGVTRKNFGYQAEKLQLSDPSPVPGVVCPPRSRSVDGPNNSPQGTSASAMFYF